MEDIVIGVDDEATARTAVMWIINRAQRGPVRLRLVAELDDGGSNPGTAKQTLTRAVQNISSAAPGSEVDYVLADRPLLHELLERSESADMLVVGSHPDPDIRDGHLPSLPVSLAARSHCPVVIVPEDWSAQDGPVVLGVEAGGERSAAVDVAAREAIASGSELRLVHTWESWQTLDTRTEHIQHGEVVRATAERIHADFPAVHLSVVLEEAIAHEGVIANSRDASLIVLGTHGIGRETGVVLGAIHQEVMISGRVALCTVRVGA
jgi:nucleotide-binding universal stress UspA family protein